MEENKVSESDESKAQTRSSTAGLVSLLILAAILLVSIYFGRPMLEKWTSSLSDKEGEPVEPTEAASIDVTERHVVSTKDPQMNHEGMKALVPILHGSLAKIEEEDIELLYLGLHDDEDEVAVDYRVRGSNETKHCLMRRDDYGRIYLLATSGRVLDTIYPPEGFVGFDR